MTYKAVKYYFIVLFAVIPISTGGAQAVLAADASPPVLKFCYDAEGKVVNCAGTGQDGDLQAGRAWPEPRFIDNLDGTITDNLTGLMWLQDAGCVGKATWHRALDTVAEFNADPASYNCEGYSAAYQDWTLPNIHELQAFFNAEEISIAGWLNNSRFVNVEPEPYWSSTTYANPYNAWVVNMHHGGISYRTKIQQHGIWLVRPVVPAATQVSQTGQVQVYAAADDGALKRGVPWPAPRFTDNDDGTVTDELTGLMWVKDASLLQPSDWQTALEAISQLNTDPNDYADKGYSASYADWRLPNAMELSSIIAPTEDYPALPRGQQFADLQSSYYWSSTSVPAAPETAWGINVQYGDMVSHDKSSKFPVLPVRSTQAGVVKPWKTAFWKGGFVQAYAAIVEEDLEEDQGPLFIDNGDGTMTNTKTGKMWLQDVSCIGKFNWDLSFKMISAFNYEAKLFNCTDYTARYNDWRIPTLEELKELENPEEPNIAEWLSEQGFYNVEETFFWTAIDSKRNLYYAWIVNMRDGRVMNVAKSFKFVVWPVRDGN